MKSIAFFIVFLLQSIAAFSQPKGSGTKDDPIQIGSIMELQVYLSSYSKLYFVLSNDIDALETRNWFPYDHDNDTTTPEVAAGFKPIYAFSGSLDGQGHVIKDLYLYLPNRGSVGIISNLSGSVKRLGLENCDVTGCALTGGICGKNEGGSIDECYTTGKITVICSPSSYGPSNIGGLCGYTESLKMINNSYSTCTINCQSDEYDYSVASFVNGRAVSRCYTTGKVNSKKKASAFGMHEPGELCFWDTETTGLPEILSGGYNASGKSTSEMYKKETYFDWDFEKIWYIDEGKDYPKLRAFLKDTTGIEQKISASAFSLQINPNPTDKVTEIKYSLPESSNVTLTITNFLGLQEQQILSNEYQSPGEYSLSLDVSSLSSGLYFCTLKEGGFSQTKQIVVIK